MKKIKLILLLALVALLVTACGKGASKEDKAASEAASGSGVDEEEEAEEEDEDEIDFEEIDQDTADKILEEKLQDAECHAIFSEYTDVDDVHCFLYSVVNKNEEELSQMLAVNAVSGEVLVYDADNDKLLPYDRFEFYVDDGNGPVSWDGKYYLSPRTVTLMPADDNSFEFSIKKDKEKEPNLEGVASVSGEDTHEAIYEDEDISLTFVYKGDTLEIRDNGNISGVAGIYERQD